MRISIVIPTFNRASLYALSIPALTNQITDGFTYEVIFVANGSTDDTDTILKSVVAASPEIFRYFWIQPTGGPSAPRNVGLRAATGDIVIIIDDDVVPDSDLVLRHAEFHRQHPERHAAAVGQTYVPDSQLEDPLSIFHSHYSYDRFRNAERLSFFDFWTCNVSFKREFMLQHGMFEEKIVLMEDVEVGHRLERAGMHLHYLPAARGQHLHHGNPATLKAKAFEFGRSVHVLTEYLPGELMKRRFGMVSTDLGVKWFISRLVRLLGFLLLDNPLTRLVLRLLGGTRPKRSTFTDAYYALVFRRAFFAGYYKTAFQARGNPNLTGATQE
jgi:glycosyltransferase involved in cell wall biosynthesis